jgi:hypothetical protein
VAKTLILLRFSRHFFEKFGNTLKIGKMATQKKILQLKVLFDTNVLFNGSTSDLLTKEVTELIEKYATSSDIKISWHLPQVVLDERRFQMRKKGSELFPSLEKLEKLLGHNLGITKDIVEARIDDAINKTVLKYKLETENIDVQLVNWNEIIRCSVFRLPPFEDSSKVEKGFRDALILESAMQLIAKSPTSPSICRIFLVTNDKLFTEAFNSKIQRKSNVDVLGSVEALESIINILDSQIQESTVNSLSKKASDLFFIADNNQTLYYKGNVGNIINTKFKKELTEVPVNADSRENGQWYISGPGFVKKEKQKITWRSIISVDSNAFIIKYTYKQPFQRLGGGPLGGIAAGLNPSSIFGISGNNSGLLGTSGLGYRTGQIQNEPNETIQSSKEIITTGKTKFEVIWSVTLTTKQKLTSAKIESINFIETIWT